MIPALLNAPDVSYWLKAQLRELNPSEETLKELWELKAFTESRCETPPLTLNGFLANHPLNAAGWSRSMFERAIELAERDPVDALRDVVLLIDVVVKEMNETL